MHHFRGGYELGNNPDWSSATVQLLWVPQQVEWKVLTPVVSAVFERSEAALVMATISTSFHRCCEAMFPL